jgi:hypothetical protein
LFARLQGEIRKGKGVEERPSEAIDSGYVETKPCLNELFDDCAHIGKNMRCYKKENVDSRLRKKRWKSSTKK